MLAKQIFVGFKRKNPQFRVQSG